MSAHLGHFFSVGHAPGPEQSVDMSGDKELTVLTKCPGERPIKTKIKSVALNLFVHVPNGNMTFDTMSGQELSVRREKNLVGSTLQTRFFLSSTQIPDAATGLVALYNHCQFPS
ncbi:MAG TPA: hypothetical protein VH575_13365, partial [Gemmataceae bacterium]